MNAVLARLHGIDWQAIGLDGFGRPGSYFSRQISRWTRQWHASKTREIPEIERLIAWLPSMCRRATRRRSCMATIGWAT